MIPGKIDGQQQAIDQQPVLPQPDSPEKIDAAQIAQQQRRVAQRQQQAAAIADDENEKHNRVGDLPALAIRLDQGPDQEHRRPGCADEAGQQRPDGHESGVRPWMGGQIAGDADSAANRIQAEQQHDERNVFVGQRVDQHRAGPRKTGRRMDERDREQRGQGHVRGHVKLVQVALPPMGRPFEQRQNRDRRQQQNEWQHQPDGGRGQFARGWGSSIGRHCVGRHCGVAGQRGATGPAGGGGHDVADDQDQNQARHASIRHS